MTQKKLQITGHDTLEIFGAIGFDGKRKDDTVWRQVGTGRLNPNGSVDLQFDCWPTNLQLLQLRVSKPEIA